MTIRLSLRFAAKPFKYMGFVTKPRWTNPFESLNMPSMNTKTRNLLRGAGSVMDIAPARDLRKMAPKMSSAERMASHFARVGGAVSAACGKFENDGKTPANKAKAA